MHNEGSSVRSFSVLKYRRFLRVVPQFVRIIRKKNMSLRTVKIKAQGEINNGGDDNKDNNGDLEKFIFLFKLLQLFRQQRILIPLAVIFYLTGSPRHKSLSAILYLKIVYSRRNPPYLSKFLSFDATIRGDGLQNLYKPMHVVILSLTRYLTWLKVRLLSLYIYDAISTFTKPIFPAPTIFLKEFLKHPRQ